VIRTNNKSVIAEGMLLNRQCQESPSGIRLIFRFGLNAMLDLAASLVIV
jgi:hypothetical protein